MFGRCNICVAGSDSVSLSPGRHNPAGRRKTRSKGIGVTYVIMKKIKPKLVTIVTDNVLLVGIVGNKNLLARMLQEMKR
jgi:hypothetical protein